MDALGIKQVLCETERFCFVDWGTREYLPSIEKMKEHVALRKKGSGKDTIFLVEHFPVITLGRRGKKEHILGTFTEKNPSVGGIPVVETDRGGDVTLHCPGQLVIYPVIALKVREQRLHDLLSAYEELMIRTAQQFGVEAFRIKGKTGAWTKQGKLASIGIHLKHWISYHGIALNVSNDLGLFNHIIPCGLYGIKMTSLEKETGQKIDIKKVKDQICKLFPPVWNDFRNACCF